MTEKDKITILNERLKEILENFEAFRKSGIDEDLLETYIQSKMKISRQATKKFLRTFDDFYHGLVKENILDALEKNEKK